MQVTVFKRGHAWYFDDVTLYTDENGNKRYIGNGREFDAESLRCVNDPDCYIQDITDFTPDDLAKREVIGRIFALLKMTVKYWVRINPEALSLEALKIVELSLKNLLANRYR